MEQADRRMHKYFAIDQVGKNTWFQPIQELIGRPEFVCDRSGRWHENSNKKWITDRKQTALGCRLFQPRPQRKAKKRASLIVFSPVAEVTPRLTGFLRSVHRWSTSSDKAAQVWARIPFSTNTEIVTDLCDAWAPGEHVAAMPRLSSRDRLRAERVGGTRNHR
jgi:hypothetical protein